MTTDAGDVIEGVVLCRVGADRLAVRAHEVTAFEIADADAPYAGTGFDPAAKSPLDARLLRSPTGGLAVDSLEVHTERVRLMPVPDVLARAWGGALAGFVEAGGALWPVVTLARLANPEHRS